MASRYLTLQHKQLLTDSAIAPEVAAVRGYETVTDVEFLRAEGYADYQALVPALFIPRYDVHGQNGSSQIRPDKPRVRDGAPVKYETPLGAHNTLDVHPSMTQHLGNPRVPLFITEGVRKADAITSLGYTTIGLDGVYGWRGTNDSEGKTALPDFEQVAWNGRDVYMIFDSDVRTNTNVHAALRRLHDYLTKRGAQVSVILPPAMSDAAKRGIDDYLGSTTNADERVRLWNALFANPAHSFDVTVRKRGGLVRGGSFLRDRPAGVPAVWGVGDMVVWAEGEPLLIPGPEGARKTTVAGQVAFGLCGVPGFDEVFGLPVARASGNVVYLALDRPDQIGRCLRRLCPEEHWDLLDEKLLIWEGELPFDIKPNDEEDDKLRDWLLELGASHVIIDSLKDVHQKLSDEEVGAKLVRSFKRCIVAGIQVAILHHNRKATGDNKKPKTIHDVYGSSNLTKAMGSIAGLWCAAPGDEEVEFLHIKQPAKPVGPLVLRFDPDNGRGDIDHIGTLKSDAKSNRKASIRRHFNTLGATGVTLNLNDLVMAGLGSENTVRDAMKDLVAEGWFIYNQGVGQGQHSTWTSVAPLANKEDTGGA
jgi:hypothetical protein